MTFWKSIAALSLCVAAASQANAQEWYVGGTIALAQQNDSDNSGQTGAFTTGNLGDGSTLDVADGTAYGWSTEFDSGFAIAAEAGLKYANNFRSGVELVYTQSDVDTHSNVTPHSLGHETVAEGIETAEQAAFLRARGCVFAQGFYYCRPLAAGAFRERLATWNPDLLVEGILKAS
ncbi:MAG: EAL domain-containing protein [Pseudomonadota bacterium]